MHRLLATIATAAVALTGAVALAVPAGAGADVNPCKLVKKKEAKKILAAKIVEVEREGDESTGAQSCTWVSNKYSDDSFEESDSPYSLEVAVQPLTDDVREALDSKDDLEPISGLGDEAYIDGFDVVVIQGEDVIVAETHNWAGDITPQTDRAERAVRLALERLPQG